MSHDDSSSGGGASRGPGETTSRILANKDRILRLWVERVREQIPAAANEHRPILIDTLPALIRQIAEAISPSHPRRTATEGSTIAEEHGGERVRIGRFRLQDVITEYKILREALFEVLEEREPLRARERNTLNASIDQAIAKAATAYVLVQEGMRDQLFATLTHDLRSPLNTAKMNLQMILRKPAGEEVPRRAARAIEAVDRANKMLEDLLDAMRVQAGGRVELSIREIDCVDLVRTCIEHLQSTHGDRFVLAAPAPVRGWVDPEVLRRAIENLAENAVKYGASGRPISITVRQTNERVFFLVHNHGTPIPPEHQQMLFQAFHRLEDASASGRRGWGLGLAQARAAAEAHGGSITVDSLPELGTTFTIDIPLDARPYQPAPLTG